MTDPLPMSRESRVSSDRWNGLQTLIWARLLVAALGLPLGVLLRPEPSVASWGLLGIVLAIIGALSGLYWLGTTFRRAYLLQVYLQVGLDVTLITGMAALTGGHQSPFALFYVLAVITGGLQAGLTGALLTAGASSAGLLALHPSGTGLVNPFWSGALPKPGMYAPLLVALGVLSAALRRRVEHAREHLARAARELDRVRFDNDVILRHLTSGVITLDGTGTVAYLNPAAEEVLGVRIGEVHGRWVQDALPHRLQPLRDVLLGTLERHDTRHRGELMLSSREGRELPVGISTNVLRHDGQVTGAVAVFQDLSVVREMEIQNRRNQTLAEVGALAAGIAHELRNGLSPISGSIEILQRELRLEGENAQLMELMQTECTRLNRFVTDLLSYSRERPLVKETFDLGEALGDLCDALQRDPRRAPGVAIRYVPGEGTAEVSGDREQLRQVWLNLTRNALEAMGERGTLTVTWHEGAEGRLEVRFADDGSGITPDDLSRVGEPFFTTKKGGTGLGIPIAQRIVERHQGNLVLSPATGQGTIATVSIPGTVVGLARAA